MQFHALTFSPGAFKRPFDDSIIGRAAERGLIAIQLTNIRDYEAVEKGWAEGRPPQADGGVPQTCPEPVIGYNPLPLPGQACPKPVEGKGVRGMAVRLGRIQHPAKATMLTERPMTTSLAVARARS